MSLVTSGRCTLRSKNTNIYNINLISLIELSDFLMLRGNDDGSIQKWKRNERQFTTDKYWCVGMIGNVDQFSVCGCYMFLRNQRKRTKGIRFQWSLFSLDGQSQFWLPNDCTFRFFILPLRPKWPVPKMKRNNEKMCYERDITHTVCILLIIILREREREKEWESNRNR